MTPDVTQLNNNNRKKKRRTEIPIKEKVRLVNRFKGKYGHIENKSKSYYLFRNELWEELGPDSTPSYHTFLKWIKKVDDEELTETMSNNKRKREIKSITHEAETRSISDSDFAQGIQFAYPNTTRLPDLPLLKIERCQESDVDEYHKHLWSQPEVMKLYLDGEVRTRDYVAGRVKMWSQRWDDNYPFSAFTVRLPDENNTFLGTMVLGLSYDEEEENCALIAGLLRQEYWGRGFATAGMIHLLAHARELFQNGLEVADGKPFERIVASCHPDNIQSRRLLEYQRFRQYTPPTLCTPSTLWRRDRLHYEFQFSSLERGCTGLP